jgi:hypothetical protein
MKTIKEITSQIMRAAGKVMDSATTWISRKPPRSQYQEATVRSSKKPVASWHWLLD